MTCSIIPNRSDRDTTEDTMSDRKCAKLTTSIISMSVSKIVHQFISHDRDAYEFSQVMSMEPMNVRCVTANNRGTA